MDAQPEQSTKQKVTVAAENARIKVKENKGKVGVASAIHTVLALFALFLSFKCNGGFKASHFLAACCCPYIYIVWVLATRGYKFCF